MFVQFFRVLPSKFLESSRTVVIPATKFRARSEVLSPFQGDVILSKPPWPESINEDVAAIAVDRVVHTADTDPIPHRSRRTDESLRVEILPERAEVVGETGEFVAITR